MHNIERFYQHKEKSIAYLKRHCMKSQLLDIDDIYHDALIIANRRKIKDPSRDDGLCLFSGYSTALRSGNCSDWHYKNEFISIDESEEFLSRKDEVMSPEEKYLNLSNLEKIANSYAMLIFFCTHLRGILHISLTVFFGEYPNMSKIGEDCGLSRERIRQLRNQGVSIVRTVIDEMDKLNKYSKFVCLPIDGYDYLNTMPKIPDHLSFLSIQSKHKGNFLLALYKYIKVVSVYFSVFKNNFSFEKFTNYKGIVMEEAAIVSKDIFLCLSPSPINIYYHHSIEILEIGWLRELFAKFVKDENGWFDELAQDDGYDLVYYKDIPEIIDSIVFDYIGENFEKEEYEAMEKDLQDKFLRFFIS